MTTRNLRKYAMNCKKNGYRVELFLASWYLGLYRFAIRGLLFSLFGVFSYVFELACRGYEERNWLISKKTSLIYD